MNVLEILLGQLPEAIFFSLFMIFTKDYKEKRAWFIVLTSIEYILLFNFFPYSSWSHVLFFIVSYLFMKVLYKDKCCIIDVFMLEIASIVLSLLSLVSYVLTLGNMLGCTTLSRILMMIFMVGFKKHLPKLQKLYYKFWNRRSNKYKKIKSTTFRALNLVIFNMSFAVINLLLVICSIEWR